MIRLLVVKLDRISLAVEAACAAAVEMVGKKLIEDEASVEIKEPSWEKLDDTSARLEDEA